MKKIIEILDRKNNKISIVAKNISYFEGSFENYDSFKNRFNLMQ